MSTNCSLRDSPVYQNCDCQLPLSFCVLANISGYASTVLWFLVLVPQVWRNFRKHTVVGLSWLWAVANFTAALNNTFFVFKSGSMPWYVYGSAVYMPILEGLLLVQFFYYTGHSAKKFVVCGLCILMWTTIVVSQLFFDVYQQFEWISIFFWASECFPQILLNMRRRSTHGLSNLSVAITAIGKSTDFMQNYLLIMPLQYVVMAFFSSSVAQIGTIQVFWYWNQIPVDEELGEIERLPISSQCQFLRWFGLIFFGFELITFIAALILRTQMLWLLGAAVIVYGLILSFYIYTRSWCHFP